jgi:hypothetical protein
MGSLPRIRKVTVKASVSPTPLRRVTGQGSAAMARDSRVKVKRAAAIIFNIILASNANF